MFSDSDLKCVGAEVLHLISGTVGVDHYTQACSEVQQLESDAHRLSDMAVQEEVGETTCHHCQYWSNLFTFMLFFYSFPVFSLLTYVIDLLTYPRLYTTSHPTSVSVSGDP